jgi:hypothetical protein
MLQLVFRDPCPRPWWIPRHDAVHQGKEREVGRARKNNVGAGWEREEGVEVGA